ncbi:hypothetical protein EOK96_28755 [Klebsiella oxytoca]|nr:hypothetical protein EOK96_28755 [Klebsiella oxytoca]
MTTEISTDEGITQYIYKSPQVGWVKIELIQDYKNNKLAKYFFKITSDYILSHFSFSTWGKFLSLLKTIPIIELNIYELKREDC